MMKKLLSVLMALAVFIASSPVSAHRYGGFRVRHGVRVVTPIHYKHHYHRHHHHYRHHHPKAVVIHRGHGLNWSRGWGWGG